MLVKIDQISDFMPHTNLHYYIQFYIQVRSKVVAWVQVRGECSCIDDHGIQVSHSKVYNIQVKRDDHEAGRINTRAIRPLPKQAQFKPVGKRGERYL